MYELIVERTILDRLKTVVNLCAGVKDFSMGIILAGGDSNFAEIFFIISS
jgi:hypothetical protein